MKTKVSIITINYNNSIGLEATIKSVVSQSYVGFEYLVIDGNSSDGSIGLLEEYSKNINYWISEKDSGVYEAMNKGIIKATGEYIIFLNSGDLFFDKNILEKCVQHIEGNESIDIWYGDMLIPQTKSAKSYVYTHPDKLSLDFFKNETINHQASLIKRNLFEQFGLYPEHYKLASDYWLFFLSFVANKKFEYLNFPMVLYDFNGLSATDGFKKYKEEQHAIWEEVLPEYVRILFNKNKNLTNELANSRNLLNYRLVRVSVGLNSVFQRIKKWLK